MLGPCSSRSVYPGTSGTKPTLGGPGCRLPSLPQPPTRPTSSPDVYTGWSGPLPAWDRLNKHTGSYVAPASSFPQTAVSQAGLPQAPPPHPRSRLQILPYRLCWGLLCPTDTWRDTLTQSMTISRAGANERGPGSGSQQPWGLGPHSFWEAQFPHL